MNDLNVLALLNNGNKTEADKISILCLNKFNEKLLY